MNWSDCDIFFSLLKLVFFVFCFNSGFLGVKFFFLQAVIHSLKSNIAPENQRLVQMNFPFGAFRPIFRCKLAVSFREVFPTPSQKVDESFRWNGSSIRIQRKTNRDPLLEVVAVVATSVRGS